MIFVFYCTLCIGGGTIVVGLYYLLYMLTIKKKQVVTSSSLVIRTPLIIGFVNVLLGILILPFVLNLLPAFFYTDCLSLIVIYILIYYYILVSPVAIGSITISFMEYKKGLITSKRLGIVTLVNIIGIVLVFVFFFILMWSFGQGEH